MKIILTKKHILILSIVLVTLFGVLMHFMYGFSSINRSGFAFASDDAFISYKYAQNLFLGNGINFNSFGEKVEGYSNFLYVLLMTPGIAISQNYIYVYSTIVNTLLLLMVMVVFYKILTLEIGEKYALLGAFLVGLNPAIWANVTTGLETILILFIFVSIWYLTKKTRTGINILLIFIISTISMLSRVDGFILPLILSIYFILNKEKKIALYLILYIFMFMGFYALLRYNYYGDVIANTYYAKVSGDIFQRIVAGYRYLYGNTVNNGIAFYLLFVILFILNKLLLKYKNIKYFISFELIFLGVWLPYMLYVGGDIYYERFLLPVLLVGIYYFIKILSNQKKIIAVILLSVAVVISFRVFLKDGRFAYQNKTYDMWVNLGKFLNKSPENYLLAVDAAGKIPYYSQLNTIDMLGLNNKKIGKMSVEKREFRVGHTKYNADYTLSKKPDIITGWMHPNGDMYWGLSKIKYHDTYILKYLVNVTRMNKTVNIFDVEKFPKVYKQLMIHTWRFGYGVLVKKSSLSNVPSLDTHIQKSLLPKPIKLSEKIDFNSSDILFDSWSTNSFPGKESYVQWNLDDVTKVFFSLGDKLPSSGKITFKIDTLRKQEIKLTINDHYIGSKTVNGNDINITFKYNPNILYINYLNALEFKFSNAYKPNDGNQRVLGISLKSFTIE